MESKKTAIVTGGTDGIGRATAERLAAEGWKVVMMSRSAERCQAAVAEITQKTGNASVSWIAVDVSNLAEVQKACQRFREEHSRLDLLLLNANAIQNQRIVTSEGHEKNFALGYLSRILMVKMLEPILASTPKSQILSVVGMSFSRLDFGDITIEKQFTGWKGLTRWQWAMVLYVREFQRISKVPMNLFMPGLVRTKILSNEPQPMRMIVKIMNLIIGISPEKSAGQVVSVVGRVSGTRESGVYFSKGKEKGTPKLEVQKGDVERLWEMTDRILGPYLS